MKKLLTIAAALAAVMLTLLAVQTTNALAAKAITVKGSDTMINLGQAWAQAFSQKLRIPVSVAGGGSGVGIAALINHSTEIAQASRPMSAKEINDAREKGVSPYKIVTAWDGVAVVVHPKNAVKKLTVEQLAGIFSGKITNWKDVGGANAKIVVLIRDMNSGTHVFFKEHVVQRNGKNKAAQYSTSARANATTQAIVDEVSQNVNAIGYVGLGYITDTVHVVAVKADGGKDFVLPSVKTVMDKTYAVARELYWYTNGKPTGDVKKFVDFVLGSDGQKIVRALDFVPVK
jgi:phosphate transport system substrate-binding protein